MCFEEEVGRCVSRPCSLSFDARPPNDKEQNILLIFKINFGFGKEGGGMFK